MGSLDLGGQIRGALGLAALSDGQSELKLVCHRSSPPAKPCRFPSRSLRADLDARDRSSRDAGDRRA